MVSVIGAGLAGCEAAYRLAQAGIKVTLYEMKPSKYTPAHSYKGFAELVCSNSLKAMRIGSAAGMLKEEMRLFNSLILECAEENAVSAGGALAVDRENFSDSVTEKINQHDNITVVHEEVKALPEGIVLIAAGPLASEALTDEIAKLTGKEYLSFFDAAAPIVEFSSVNMDKAFFASRYNRGDADYINCPFTKEEYEVFYNELVNARQATMKDFESESFKVYEGCMPIEVMAKRGIDTMRFGPLKPVGIYDPVTDKRPWAVVQLRKENNEGSMYNIVGFQTNLAFPEQKRVFSMIPGLEDAQFFRYGVMHRNTFINSPALLDATLALKADNRIYFAGQITGVEGYTESAMSGIIAAENIIRRIKDEEALSLPLSSMSGALINYITTYSGKDFQPMGCNMGILPSNSERIKDKSKRYEAQALRGLSDLKIALNLE